MRLRPRLAAGLGTGGNRGGPLDGSDGKSISITAPNLKKQTGDKSGVDVTGKLTMPSSLTDSDTVGADVTSSNIEDASESQRLRFRGLGPNSVGKITYMEGRENIESEGVAWVRWNLDPSLNQLDGPGILEITEEDLSGEIDLNEDGE